MQKPCDESPHGHGWMFDTGTYAIRWYDIYRALEENTTTPIVEEVEDEDFAYEENLYGADEANDEDDFL